MTGELECQGTSAGEVDLARVAARLEELLGGRSEREVALVARLVRGFPTKASGLVECWLAATLRGERDEAARAVHTLKGTALNLGSVSLGQVCEQVESYPADGPADGAADGVRARHDQLTSATASLTALLARAAPEFVP